MPLAGKVSHCLFDKTGTLTTDQLVPVGIVNADIAAKPRDVNAIPELTEVKTAEGETALILAACHSLVVIEDDDDEQEESKSTENGQPNLVGDPIELSAIRGIEWSWDGKTSTAKPDGTFKRQTAALAVVTSKKAEILAKPQSERTPIQNSQMEALEKEEKSLRSKITLSNEKVANSRFTAVEVLHRHHFSSKLKRMSVVVKCHEKSSSQSKESYYCLVKGSPEAIQSLLQQNSTPIWFTACYEQLARRGLRVLALAYKRVEKVENDSLQSRSWAESELFFGGFIAFECKVRADSEVVVRSLQQSDHRVIMVTGDALLTSLHIAKQVGICNKKKPSISLTVDEVNDKIVWTVQHDEYKENKDELLFDAKKIAEMAKRYNLLTTEDNFLFATDRTGGKDSPLWKFCGDVAVFARMSPQGKAKIIQSIQENDKDAHICMCGDGGNDVGALKQVITD